MITAPRFFLYRAALNLACGLGALACLIPAIDVNLVAHFARGGAWYEAAIFVVSVIAASAATIALRGAIERCDVSMGFIAGLILIAALAFNLTNALASSRLIRAHFADPRADIAKKIAALKAERTEILGSLGSASGPSVEEVEAELQKLEANLLFARSKECRDVTLGDSSAYCAHRADVLGKLAAARERAAKLQRLDEIRDRLAQLPAAPEVIDPKVDSLIAILSGLGWAKEAEPGTHRPRHRYADGALRRIARRLRPVHLPLCAACYALSARGRTDAGNQREAEPVSRSTRAFRLTCAPFSKRVFYGARAVEYRRKSCAPPLMLPTAIAYIRSSLRPWARLSTRSIARRKIKPPRTPSIWASSSCRRTPRN